MLYTVDEYTVPQRYTARWLGRQADAYPGTPLYSAVAIRPTDRHLAFVISLLVVDSACLGYQSPFEFDLAPVHFVRYRRTADARRRLHMERHP